MKYFTPDLWAGWNGNLSVFDKAVEKWDANVVLYQKILKKLAPRLGARNSRFFTHTFLHDGQLLLFGASDWSTSVSKANKGLSETSLRVEVLAGLELDTIYRLYYGGIREIALQTNNNLFPLDCSRFGYLGYHELLPEGRSAFRHNMLFQTGTQISISFERFRFTTVKASEAELSQYPNGVRSFKSNRNKVS